METSIEENIRGILGPYLATPSWYVRDLLAWVISLPPAFILVYIIILLFLCAVMILVVRDIVRLAIMIILNKQTTAEGVRVQIMNNGGSKKILIAGDSTAVGTGANKIEDTIMGMFAHDYPHIEIHNTAMNGALTTHVIAQLERVKNEHFSLALISTGGNDVWRLTTFSKIERDLNEVIERALSVAGNRVVLLVYSNIASAPVFPIFFRSYLLRRANRINQIFRSIAHQYHIPCVEMFTESKSNPFIHQPEKFFARDGIHPNASGYRLWYNRLWKVLANYRFDLGSQSHK